MEKAFSTFSGVKSNLIRKILIECFFDKTIVVVELMIQRTIKPGKLIR